ncbi:hypothetical protein Pfo_024428 [Paulownia fortunei]|nr:hypothetical protein Pfo_024428 [Paulownia fortunei]
MYYIVSKYLLQIFILSTFVFQATASEKRFCLFTLKYAVHVVNNLPPNSPSLLLHCASGNDDLGNHTLTANQDFHFDFCINFKTLFFCHLWWNGKNIAFDVYSYKWPTQRCVDGVCYWAAKSDGIYHSKHYPPKDLTKEYSW